MNFVNYPNNISVIKQCNCFSLQFLLEVLFSLSRIKLGKVLKTDSVSRFMHTYTRKAQRWATGTVQTQMICTIKFIHANQYKCFMFTFYNDEFLLTQKEMTHFILNLNKCEMKHFEMLFFNLENEFKTVIIVIANQSSNFVNRKCARFWWLNFSL